MTRPSAPLASVRPAEPLALEMAAGLLDAGQVLVVHYPTTRCYIITGKGIHSKDGEPKIRNGVEALAQARGLRYWLEDGCWQDDMGAWHGGWLDPNAWW